MRHTGLTDAHGSLLCVLFCLFESLFLTSVLIAFCLDPRRRSGIEGASGLAFWFAFIGLFVVSFILRRAHRRLAVIGWLTLFLGILSLMLFPVV